MNETPLVTVICLCFNHSAFVEAAIDSVTKQTYPFIELIIVDDCSTDNSVEIIQQLISKNTTLRFIGNRVNLGNCTSFNQALKIANGKYIIDLAADDILLPNKIEVQVAAFEELDATYGLVFSNGYYIDINGKFLHNHYKVDRFEKSLIIVPEGDVFTRLFQGHFICSPTVMFKKDILIELGGYDQRLSYEDFDIWMRIARKYKFYYLDKITVGKRIVPGSLSSQFYNLKQNKLLESTLIISVKAQQLCKNLNEKKALSQFISYHFKLAFFTNNLELCKKFYSVLSELQTPSFVQKGIFYLSSKNIKIGRLYRLYLHLKLQESKL